MMVVAGGGFARSIGKKSDCSPLLSHKRKISLTTQDTLNQKRRNHILLDGDLVAHSYKRKKEETDHVFKAPINKIFSDAISVTIYCEFLLLLLI